MAQAITGWDVTVRKKIAKETLWRVVLSRQVLVNAYRVMARDTAVRRGITVEEVQDMKLASVVIPMLAVKVWQDTNKLAGLVGRGVGRLRFWACMHMLRRDGLLLGDVERHHRDRSWDGMADEMRRLQAMNTCPPLGPLREDLQDSPEVSEEEAEGGERDDAAAPGTGAEAEAGQLMIPGVLEEEVMGGDAAEQGGRGPKRCDATPWRRRCC